MTPEIARASGSVLGALKLNGLDVVPVMVDHGMYSNEMTVTTDYGRFRVTVDLAPDPEQ